METHLQTGSRHVRGYPYKGQGRSSPTPLSAARSTCATRQGWSLLPILWKTLCVIFWSAESHAYSPLVYLLPTPTVREDRNVVVTDGLPEEEDPYGMIPKVNLAYVFFPFTSNTNFTILLQKPTTKTMTTAMSTHKSTRPRMSNTATTMSKLVSFCLFSTNCFN